MVIIQSNDTPPPPQKNPHVSIILFPECLGALQHILSYKSDSPPEPYGKQPLSLWSGGFIHPHGGGAHACLCDVCCSLFARGNEGGQYLEHTEPRLEASSSQYYPVGPAAEVSVLFSCTVSVLSTDCTDMYLYTHVLLVISNLGPV